MEVTIIVARSAVKKKKGGTIFASNGKRQIAAGEFKAKCLGLIDEVDETGQEVVITKWGKPKAKLIPFASKRKSLMGSMVGVIEIIGDPDDLIKPVFPLEDYDMLK
jgi:prevent-host-death family protein